MALQCEVMKTREIPLPYVLIALDLHCYVLVVVTTRE